MSQYPLIVCSSRATRLHTVTSIQATIVWTIHSPFGSDI